MRSRRRSPAARRSLDSAHARGVLLAAVRRIGRRCATPDLHRCRERRRSRDARWGGDPRSCSRRPFAPNGTTRPPARASTAVGGPSTSRSPPTAGDPGTTPSRRPPAPSAPTPASSSAPPGGSRADPARARHHDVERLQRLGRAVPLHRRDTRLVRAAVRERVPGEAGAGRADDADHARPRGDGLPDWARPLGLSDWSGGAGWWNWERPFLRWAESNGYRVDVATSHDLEAHPEILDGHRLSLHVGHDEYWSWGMRDALDAFVGRGGNAAIFSGNTCFWQIRFEDDGRAMTCFKYRAGAEDPVVGTPDERLLSGIWSDRRVGRPETSTIGLTFTRGGYSRYGLGVPRRPAATPWRGPTTGCSTGPGLRDGDTFGERDAIVAYEVDGCAFTIEDGRPVPDARGRQPRSARDPGDGARPSLVAGRAADPLRARARRARARRGRAVRRREPGNVERVADNHAVMATFTRPGRRHRLQRRRDRLAFGLKHGDPVVERITRNVLDRLGGDARPSRTS